MKTRHNLSQLHELAHAHGIETDYYDMGNHRREASPEAILLVLKALGSPVETFDDIPSALKERHQATWRRCLEPVVVVWDGVPAAVELRLPLDQATGSLAYHLNLENGGVRSWSCDVAELPTLESVNLGGERYVRKRLPIPSVLPWGYHRLVVEAPAKLSESMLISAPQEAYPSPEGSVDRVWGMFLPLYALHTQRSWGSGDFSDLETLIEWVSRLGGSVVATLPLLACFFDEQYDQSPYAPVSRLFWNEFYLDVTEIPELRKCDPAQAMLESDDFKKELEALRSLRLVDHSRQMSLKRAVLKELAGCFFSEASDRLAGFRRFVESQPRVEDYACFRAACERQNRPWWEWPQPLRDGILKRDDYDEETKRYHTYVQWLAHQQLHDLSEKSRERGSGLYMDLPLGVRPDGYDVWRERDLFAMDVVVGAPPDILYSKGQNWLFPPPHPEAIREQQYRYITDYLDNHLKYAGLLRMDHVMSLHRLFWIPKGFQPSDGIYVRYADDELCAILSLESHRHRCPIVGENLGTVPEYVNEMMSRHNIHGMYVVQYELTLDRDEPLRKVLDKEIASLNTHDMPPFSAYWGGLDIEDRLARGLLDMAGARAEQETRQALKRAIVCFLQRDGWLQGSPVDDAYAVLSACLKFLGASPARVVLVNLEDLWLEVEPQNRPGILGECSNWRRKAQHSLQSFSKMPEVQDTLKEIDRLIKQAGGKP
ncbi:MAG: 4-alpha-glucanotransferase [Chloroflexi bacterium RBG_13_53_26]|nr:MAG: 4-alpha-glucanotransferase [Chloroflexi bacterium RBG_13_53_26]